MLNKVSAFLIRADDGNRTRDLRTTNATHYRLCYISVFYLIIFITKYSKSTISSPCCGSSTKNILA